MKKKGKSMLGNDDFEDGVAFVFEEMFLLGYEDKDTAIRLLETTFSPYVEDIILTMKRNNSDIFKERIYPELKERNLLWKKRKK